MMKIDASTQPKRVLIVDDHPLVREGLKRLLADDSALQVCGEAETVDEAIDQIEQQNPHIVLVDLALPGVNGMELIKRIRKNWLGIKVIVVSTYDQAVYGPLAKECGADCYINKHEAMDQIVQAIHATVDQQTNPAPVAKKISHWFG